MEKIQNQKAWFLVLPALAVLFIFSAVIPLMTVVNYSVQDIFGQDYANAFFVGTEWFRDTIRDPELQAAFGRQLAFSVITLLIQIPLGVAIALAMPTRGIMVSVALVLVSLPLLIPWNVVGTGWLLFTRPDIGLLGVALNELGLDYNIQRNPVDAWLTVLVMDVWHWTSLTVLLAYAGLRAIPGAYYQAARVDGASRWAIFRYVELPRMRGVLLIAILLRFMDSFKLYAEPFVLTGGGPGTTTTFLSQYLATIGVGQFDLGRAAAFSLVYFLFILALSWLFYTVITRMDRE
ncbi:sugar ABC transporter permease [Aquisalimonas lutea]|uniref:carbohydrate ABC transporter permease n=1 Tax=Aquisalimonas lutea TaxID=1327750 RepID=UPI0025B5B336|nr:sugar ABC transporter permease [Aquisalimonas lutea]MDN3516259.1 sugar ABC transporter permease [Aquisalimonas lutea]